MENESRQFPSADEIAEMATRGEDISKFFGNEFTVVRPIRGEGGSDTGDVAGVR